MKIEHFQTQFYIAQTWIYNPDIVVPQGVDLGHLTEAADHGQVNLDKTALKS